MSSRILIALLLFIWMGPQETIEVEVDCQILRMGQFMCPDPDVSYMDLRTQQPAGCSKEGKAKVWCIASDGIVCSQTKNASFTGEIPCKYT